MNTSSQLVSNLKSVFRRTLLVFAVALSPLPAFCAERWHSAQVKVLYPLGNGNFVIMFAQDSPDCASPESRRKYYRVSVGAHDVTADGAKQMYASALAAMTGGFTLAIAFDDATSNCYVYRMQINAS